LRKSGFSIACYRTIKLTTRLKLVVTQSLAYKGAANRERSDSVAGNLLNMIFNSIMSNQIRVGKVGGVSRPKVGLGWLYLVVLMGLYSRRVVGWYIFKRVIRGLVKKVFLQAYSLQKPPEVSVFHSDRGSQYK
jgi:putative transposase